MANFDLNTFTDQLRSASKQTDAKIQVYKLMQQAFSAPEEISKNLPKFAKENDVMLFEDKNISIWHSRFPANLIVPPHDHQLVAMIGVYQGVEKNKFYLPENGKLIHKSTQYIKSGDIALIEPDSIHSVQTANNQPCYAIHVYLGKLTTIKRSLFNRETGEAQVFTDTDYYQQCEVVSLEDK